MLFRSKFALPAQEERYDVYIGLYSYWFARPIGIEFNGVMLESNYSVKPSFGVYEIKNVSL